MEAAFIGQGVQAAYEGNAVTDDVGEDTRRRCVRLKQNVDTVVDTGAAIVRSIQTKFRMHLDSMDRATVTLMK